MKPRCIGPIGYRGDKNNDLALSQGRCNNEEGNLEPQSQEIAQSDEEIDWDNVLNGLMTTKTKESGSHKAGQVK